jgi:hypothetical protein
MSEAPQSDVPGPADGEAPIFVSDASVEAEALTGALRSRGYLVVDVPLNVLPSRVAVQRPSLVLCDLDAAEAEPVLARLREQEGGAAIPVLLIGDRAEQALENDSAGTPSSAGFFARPVDVYALLRRVEALLGPARHREGLSIASNTLKRSPVLVASTRKPYRYEGTLQQGSSPPPKQPEGGEVQPRPQPPVPSEPILTRESVPPGSDVSPELRALLAPTPAQVPQVPARAHIPQATLSPELEQLLREAEGRVGPARSPSSAPPARLSPEEEVDAVLPVDVLAALDEPLDLEEDEEAGSDVDVGTHGGPSGMDSEVPAAPQPVTLRREHEDVRLEPAPPTPAPPLHGDGLQYRVTTAPPRRGEPADMELDILESAAIDARERDPAPLPAEARASAAQAITPPPPMREARPEPVQDAGRAGLADAAPVPASAGQPREPEIPKTLRGDDAIVALARAIRARHTGSIAFEDEVGIRRAVFRDGDFVTVASGAEAESLTAFLAERGDLSPEVAARLGRRLPQFGRHAGAALIAQGHLRQDELWTILRAHAEWLLARIAAMAQGAAGIESETPARLKAEPAVFGGTTGSEVFVEVVRRVCDARDALARLGGKQARLDQGPAQHLLNECALDQPSAALVANAAGRTLGELLEEAPSPDFAAVLYAVERLGVIAALPTSGRATSQRPERADPLEDDALRSRIVARRALVDEGDYFALLGVPRKATGYEIRRAYLELRRELAPNVLTAGTADLRDDVDLVLEVLEEAYEILRDDGRRERYRRALMAPPR